MRTNLNKFTESYSHLFGTDTGDFTFPSFGIGLSLLSDGNSYLVTFHHRNADFASGTGAISEAIVASIITSTGDINWVVSFGVTG
jgi:hypothetical protein